MAAIQQTVVIAPSLHFCVYFGSLFQHLHFRVSSQHIKNHQTCISLVSLVVKIFDVIDGFNLEALRALAPRVSSS